MTAKKSNVDNFGSHAMAKPVMFQGKLMSRREIAAATGLCYNTVVSRIARGRPLVPGRLKTGKPHFNEIRVMFRGRLATRKEIMAVTGLSHSGVRMRCDSERFYDFDEIPRLGRKLYTWGGITDSVVGWAERAGMSRGALEKRLAKGMTFQDAITRERWPKRIKITIKGKRGDLGYWASKFQIDKGTIYRRIKQLGWTPFQAVTTPVRSKHDRDVWAKGLHTLTTALESLDHA